MSYPLIANCQPQAIYQNVAIVINFITQVNVLKNASAFSAYYAPDVIEHTPPGASLREQHDFIAAPNSSSMRYEAGGIAGDCNIVMVYGRYFGFGERPLIAVDTFRVSNGKLVEYWDVFQDEVPTEQTAGRIPMYSRLPDFNYCDAQRVRKNQALVIAFLTDVIVNKNTAAIRRYYAPNIVNHNPRTATVQDFANFITATRDTLRYDRGGVVGDCNLVMVYGRYTGFPGYANPVVGVDIFRVANGLLVEHWDVLLEEVPPAQTPTGRPLYTTLPTLPF